MKTVKVNYTPEMTAKAVADYAAGMPVEAIAAALGKSTRSIVAKLSREKVYVAKTYTAKTGEAVTSKAELVEAIAVKLGVASEVVGSLESATKVALKLVLENLPDVAQSKLLSLQYCEKTSVLTSLVEAQQFLIKSNSFIQPKIQVLGFILSRI